MSVPKFWRDMPSRYNLIGSECQKCKTVYFPPRDVCLACKDVAMKPLKLTGRGEVVSYTIVHIGQEGFEYQVPYALAIIRFEEGPRVTGQIVDCNPEKVKIGAKVKPCFRRIGQDSEEGVIYYSYKFQIDEG